MCNRFLPSRENNPHRLCVACRGKSCRSDDRCEECHDWSDDHCGRVSKYMNKLSLQREKRRNRKAKASSSSFSGFSPSMPVPLYQLPSSAGTGVVMTTPSSVCAVTFSTAAPMVSAAPSVPSVDVTPVEPSHKRRCVDSRLEKAKMLAVLKELWASSQSFSSCSGPLSAP